MGKPLTAMMRTNDVTSGAGHASQRHGRPRGVRPDALLDEATKITLATARTLRDVGLMPPDGLTPAQRTFALAYLENGFNATRAYMTAHPTVSREVGAVEGFRDLGEAIFRCAGS